MDDKNVIALSRFRADVSRALSRTGKELLVAKDLAARVQALEPLEAYFVVKELGLDDAAPILVKATPEQLQTIVDLDCWNDEQPEPQELDAWLAPFAAEGQETLAKVFLGLEEEIQVLFLAQSLTVYDVRSEEAPEVGDDVVRKTTPDAFFVLEPTTEEREVDVLFLVDSLYKASLEEAFRLLMAAKWEQTSVLAEQAMQFRNARLEELGFPSRAEAMRILTAPQSRPNTIQQFPGAAPHTSLPAVYAAALGDSLFVRAAGRLADAHLLERLERDLVYLMNYAVVAYGGSPRDFSHVGDTAARVRDTLSLGLAVMLSPSAPLEDDAGDATVARAADLLAQWPLTDIFRHGVHAASKLAADAKRLAQDPVVRSWLDKSETEADDYSEDRRDRCFLRGLLGRPPLLSGFDAARPEKKRAFKTQHELAEAAERLERLHQRIT